MNFTHLWYRLFVWLDQRQPVFCFVCKRLLFVKDAKHELTSMGVVATLCKKCHEALYSPFTHSTRR